MTKIKNQVPNSFLVKRNIKIENPVRNVQKLPLLFPKEIALSSGADESKHINIASLFKDTEAEEKEQKTPETQILPIYEPLEHIFSRYSSPDIEGKGKMPEARTFFPDSHKEWHIDNMSIGKIHQMIDLMYTEYKLMFLRGKSEIDACRTIIQCFTGTLLRWWETESSPKLIKAMEAEVLKDEKGDIIHNPNGTVISNIIGALTLMILEHWCGSETEIANKHEVILMNLKCHKMSKFDD